MLWMRDPQPAPDFRHLLVERKNMLSVICGHPLEPLLKALCLSMITPKADGLDSTTQLSNRYCREVQRHMVSSRAVKENSDAAVGPLTFAGFTDYVRVQQIHC